jgi:hypothetical protein
VKALRRQWFTRRCGSSEQVVCRIMLQLTRNVQSECAPNGREEPFQG